MIGRKGRLNTESNQTPRLATVLHSISLHLDVVATVTMGIRVNRDEMQKGSSM